MATTVHEAQVVADGMIPMTDHDVRLDLIVTPERVIRCPRRTRQGQIRWDDLTEEKIAAIPVLGALKTS